MQIDEDVISSDLSMKLDEYINEVQVNLDISYLEDEFIIKYDDFFGKVDLQYAKQLKDKKQKLIEIINSKFAFVDYQKFNDKEFNEDIFIKSYLKSLFITLSEPLKNLVPFIDSIDLITFSDLKETLTKFITIKSTDEQKVKYISWAMLFELLGEKQASAYFKISSDLNNAKEISEEDLLKVVYDTANESITKKLEIPT